MRDAAVGVVFAENKTKVLLVKRRDLPIWVLPGGGIEDNEPAEHAVLREIYEETGLSTVIIRPVGVWLPINRIAKKAFLFECSIIDNGTPLKETSESQDIAFFPLDSLPKAFFYLHREWITAAKTMTEPVVRKMESVTYWNFMKIFLSHPIIGIRYILSRMGFPINT